MALDILGQYYESAAEKKVRIEAEAQAKADAKAAAAKAKADAAAEAVRKKQQDAADIKAAAEFKAAHTPGVGTDAEKKFAEIDTPAPAPDAPVDGAPSDNSGLVIVGLAAAALFLWKK